MAKQETLWRCSTCDKLYGSEKEALQCEEKHALFTLIQTISDNPTFYEETKDQDDIIREDITDEQYSINIPKPSSLDDINTVIITTFSTIVRRDIYQRIGTGYDPSSSSMFEFNED